MKRNRGFDDTFALDPRVLDVMQALNDGRVSRSEAQGLLVADGFDPSSVRATIELFEYLATAIDGRPH